MAFFDPPVWKSQVLQSPDFREKGGVVFEEFSVATKPVGNRKTSLEDMIGLQEHRRKIHFFSSNICRPYLKSPIFKVRSILEFFFLTARFAWLVPFTSSESLMGFHVWGWWSLGCWNRFWAKTWHVSTVSTITNPAQAESAAWDMLTLAFRNSPVGVHTQVKLICRPSNVMNRTGGCFLKHTSGWIFMKQNRLFVRFFMFDHYLILIIFFSRFSFCSNSILHDFWRALGFEKAWKRWDRTYELLARRVAAVQQSQHVGSKSSVCGWVGYPVSPWGSDLLDDFSMYFTENPKWGAFWKKPRIRKITRLV